MEYIFLGFLGLLIGLGVFFEYLGKIFGGKKR